MLSYTIYFFAVWFIPLAIIIYGIYKKIKEVLAYRNLLNSNLPYRYAGNSYVFWWR